MSNLIVGTYARNGGAGLHLLHWSGASWSPGSAYRGARNASFGVYNPRHDLFYFVDEDENALGVFRLSAGGWDCLARVATAGKAPCYVAIDAVQRCIAIAHYGSGSVALYSLDASTGIPLTPPELRQNIGSGPNADRQEGPHAHCACFSPDQRWLYQVDLGTDQILAYFYDAASSALGMPKIAFAAPAGSGPRHLVFHPTRPKALLVSELVSTLTVLSLGDGELRAEQVVSTLPRDFRGESLGGHLALNASGDRAYVTNRGHDSLTTFAWDAGARLTTLQNVPSGGASPRAFVLLDTERQLLLANEEGGNVTVFDVAPDGTLSPGGDIPIPGAAFLLAAPHGRILDPRSKP